MLRLLRLVSYSFQDSQTSRCSLVTLTDLGETVPRPRYRESPQLLIHDNWAHIHLLIWPQIVNTENQGRLEQEICGVPAQANMDIITVVCAKCRDILNSLGGSEIAHVPSFFDI